MPSRGRFSIGLGGPDCRKDVRSAPEPLINPHGERPFVTRNGVGPVMHRQAFVARNFAQSIPGAPRLVIRLSDD